MDNRIGDPALADVLADLRGQMETAALTAMGLRR